MVVNSKATDDFPSGSGWGEGRRGYFWGLYLDQASEVSSVSMNKDMVNGKVTPTLPCLSLESPCSYRAGSFSLPFLVSLLWLYCLSGAEVTLLGRGVECVRACVLA